MDSLGYIPCSSCGVVLVDGSGNNVRPWGHSHNLSVKHFPELESDPKNFSPRCQDWMGRRGCHEKLDIPDFKAIIYFNDFDQLMEYRRTHSKLAYNQWVTNLKTIGYDEDYDYIN